MWAPIWNKYSWSQPWYVLVAIYFWRFLGSSQIMQLKFPLNINSFAVFSMDFQKNVFEDREICQCPHPSVSYYFDNRVCILWHSHLSAHNNRCIQYLPSPTFQKMYTPQYDHFCVTSIISWKAYREWFAIIVLVVWQISGLIFFSEKFFWKIILKIFSSC